MNELQMWDPRQSERYPLFDSVPSLSVLKGFAYYERNLVHVPVMGRPARG
jgi:hypothetical protein